MLINNRRKRYLVTMEDVDFCSGSDHYDSRCDMTFYAGAMGKLPTGAYGVSSECIMIDLQKTEEEIFAEFRKKWRRDIRNAQADDHLGVITLPVPTQEQLDVFIGQYNRFADQKGLWHDDGVFLKAAVDNRMLSIHYAVQEDSGEIICGIASYISIDRAHGALAFSHHREYTTTETKQTASHANKLLYWESIRYAKAKGCLLYDLGDTPESVEGVEGIRHFKTGFGGSSVTTSTYYKGNTWKGKLLVALFRLQKKPIEIWDKPHH